MEEGTIQLVTDNQGRPGIEGFGGEGGPTFLLYSNSTQTLNFSWEDAFTVSANVYWPGTGEGPYTTTYLSTVRTMREDMLPGIDFGFVSNRLALVLAESTSRGIAGLVDFESADAGWYKVTFAYDPYLYAEGEDFVDIAGNSIRIWISGMPVETTYSNAEGEAGPPSALQGGGSIGIGGNTPFFGDNLDYRLAQLKVYSGVVPPSLVAPPPVRNPMALSTLLHPAKPPRAVNIWRKSV